MSDPVERTADAAREVFGSDLRCALVTGAAVRGGGIPGLTVLEMQLLFAGKEPVKYDKALAFRDRLGDLWPFGGIDPRFVPYDDYLARAARIPAPGGYRVLLGEPPDCFHDVTAEWLIEDARRRLDDVSRMQAGLVVAAMDPNTDGVLRGLARIVLAYAYDSAVVLTGTPFRVWSNDAEALEPVVESAGLGGVTGFLEAMRDWPTRRQDAEWLRARLGEGLSAIEELAIWWTGARERLVLADV